jgi:magnesium chelatase subunit ChlD-like protein
VNVAKTEMQAQEEVYRFAGLIHGDDVRAVVVNMEHAAFDPGLAAQLAEHLDALCYTLCELKAESLYQTVRAELDGAPQKK